MKNIKDIKNLNKEAENTVQKVWYEEVTADFECFKNYPEFTLKVRDKINRDKHRWYGLEFVVYELKNGKTEETSFIGVYIVTELYSEGMSIEDVYLTYGGFVLLEEVIVQKRSWKTINIE